MGGDREAEAATGTSCFAIGESECGVQSRSWTTRGALAGVLTAGRSGWCTISCAQPAVGRKRRLGREFSGELELGLVVSRQVEGRILVDAEVRSLVQLGAGRCSGASSVPAGEASVEDGGAAHDITLGRTQLELAARENPCRGRMSGTVGELGGGATTPTVSCAAGCTYTRIGMLLAPAVLFLVLLAWYTSWRAASRASACA